jgi:hypothetical protein
MQYLGIIAITLLIVEFAEPIEWIKKYLGISNQSDPKTLTKQVLQKLVNCSLCVGFWTGLILTFNLYEAAVLSFASELTYRIIKQIFNRI